MKVAVKLVGVVLMVTVTLGFVATFMSAEVAERPSGCPEHGQKIPTPTSYHCCVAGHNAAKLQTPFRLAGPAASLVVELTTQPLSIATFDPVSSMDWAPGFSPGIAPIRI